MNNIVSNCPLCEEKALHIIGESELQSQQCINCGYVTSEKFNLKGVKKEEHSDYKNFTEDMKKWSKVANDKMWIPTIMTLPIGMLYPTDVDNLVNHKKEMKWHFAEMVDIPKDEQKNFPNEKGGFYNKRIDTDNAIVYGVFLDGIAEVNRRLKELNEPKISKIKLPKLKKMK